MDNHPRLTAYRLRKGTPIVPAPFARSWMKNTGNHAYRCLPMTIANQAGWFILNDAPLVVLWGGKDHQDSVKIIYPKGAPEFPVESHFGYGIVTWRIPYVLKTPPGYNLLARGPANWPRDGIYPLEGIIETDWVNSTFTMNWKITRPNFPIAFERRDPICMIVPQVRNQLESFIPEILDMPANDGVAETYHLWDASRRAYLKERKIASSSASRQPMQGHYLRGEDLMGQKAVSHQTKLHLREFSEGEGAEDYGVSPHLA
jgi:hypothetical protein